MLYSLIILVLLVLSVAMLFQTKTRPALKPVACILPVLAFVILILRMGDEDALPVSQQFLNEGAKTVGARIAQTIRSSLPRKGNILVIHPEEGSPFYLNERIQIQLQGITEGLENSGYTLKTHALVEADAVNDLLTDGVYIGSQTLSHLSAKEENPVGVVLLGLEFAAGEEPLPAPLPPLILASTGDPGTSQWALDRGYAVAALFEKIDAPLTEIQGKNLTAEEQFNQRFEIRTLKE